MNALEAQIHMINAVCDSIMRPANRDTAVHHGCEDFDVLDLQGFTLRFVFDYTLRYSDVWPDVTITHAYIVTPTRRELPLELAEVPDLEKWADECAGRVEERQ